MSQTLPNMLENTIAKIRDMVDVNSVVGDPITTADGVTIIPVSKVSVGFGGGGSDYVSRNMNKQENPFGGGAGGGGYSHAFTDFSDLFEGFDLSGMFGNIFGGGLYE